jgi:hypothetical protein
MEWSSSRADTSTPQYLAWQGAGVPLPVDDQNSVHKDVVNPFWVTVWVVLERVRVRVQVRRPVTDMLQVEDHDVCPGTGSQHSPIPQPEPLRGKGGHLADSLLKTEHWFLPYVSLKNPRELAVATRGIRRRVIEEPVRS